VAEDPRLLLASDLADHCHDAERLRHHDAADQNSFLDEIKKQYVLTARAKGCSSRQTLYGHIFRNAMLIVIAGFPGAFVHAFFSGSLLIETIFSLDGLGLLGFESVLNRDYPVVFATLYIFALIGLVVNLISDLTYTWIDPRIDFETREV
jgi:microcin C transport system permease protein